jgi:Arc/MetJ family transcription regulator
MDLDPRVCGEIVKLMNARIPPRNKGGMGPNRAKEFQDDPVGLGHSVDRPGGRGSGVAGPADEGDVDTDALADVLRKAGLDDDAIEQAVKIALGEEDGESEEGAVNEAVRKGLRKSGLSDDAVSEIVDRVLKNRREAAEDRMPANALKHGSISGGGFGGYGHGHKNGEHEMAHDNADFY